MARTLIIITHHGSKYMIQGKDGTAKWYILYKGKPCQIWQVGEEVSKKSKFSIRDFKKDAIIRFLERGLLTKNRQTRIEEVYEVSEHYRAEKGSLVALSTDPEHATKLEQKEDVLICKKVA